MADFSVTLERKTVKRLNHDSLQSQIKHILQRSVAGSRKSWACTEQKIEGPTKSGGKYFYKLKLTFARGGKEKTADQLTAEFQSVMGFMKKTCSNIKPAWEVGKPRTSWPLTQSIVESSDSNVLDFERALTFEELNVPEVLIHGSDAEIEDFPAFQGIYGRGAHIRVIASSVHRTIVTRGEKRNHVLLHGLPGCAKSQIIIAWQKILGPGGFFTINANSATRAGIEKMFTDRFKQTGVPPICFVEELEKTHESILTVWLSILDERAEVLKINYREQSKAEAKVLSIATVNDMVLFNRLHGGRPGHPGALSSRFTKKLYVQRPDTDIMKRILLRDVEKYGGSKEWVQPCIDIAQELGTNDPRIVLSLLDGQERLLDGSYKDDILSIHAGEIEEFEDD